MPDAASRGSIETGRRSGPRAAVALIAAAILVGAMVGGAAAASAPGGALYEARLWIEDVSLPSDPSARAVAELDRLADRLREAEAAARSGDDRAAAAALGAYERIMTEASADVLAAGDPVAAAALETGLGRNVEVLEALVGHLSARAAAAISGAVARAIARSAGAIDTVGAVDRPPPAGGAAGNGATGSDQGGNSGGSKAGDGGTAGSGANGQQATPKPTKAAPEQPEATGKPAATERPDPTPRPSKTPKPNVQPPGGPPDRQD